MGQKWLMKSEPNVWSIDQQKKAGIRGTPWDGIRNYQAAKNLKSMKKNKYDEIINNIIYFLKSKEGSIYSINHFTEVITKQIVSDL